MLCYETRNLATLLPYPPTTTITTITPQKANTLGALRTQKQGNSVQSMAQLTSVQYSAAQATHAQTTRTQKACAIAMEQTGFAGAQGA